MRQPRKDHLRGVWVRKFILIAAYLSPDGARVCKLSKINRLLWNLTRYWQSVKIPAPFVFIGSLCADLGLSISVIRGLATT